MLQTENSFKRNSTYLEPVKEHNEEDSGGESIDMDSNRPTDQLNDIVFNTGPLLQPVHYKQIEDDYVDSEIGDSIIVHRKQSGDSFNDF